VTPRGRAFRDPEAFRAWLERHHATVAELIVRCYKANAGRLGMTYRQALDEALCFGWIDGVRRAVDERSFAVRFSARKAKSAWSAINLRRAAELQAAGRLQEAGRVALRGRKAPAYSYASPPQVLERSMLRRFRGNGRAWRFFEAQPPGYRRTSVFWVMSAKRPETREARFSVLLANSGAALRIPLLRRSSARSR